MSPSSQSLSAFQPPLSNTNSLTCQLQNVTRIYWGRAGRKSKWHGRDEGAKCSKEDAGEHLQGHICHGGTAHLLQWVTVRDGAQAQGSASGLLQNAAHSLVTKKAEENCKAHLPRKWRRNISEFGTTSHFCIQKSCRSTKNTTDTENKHNSYQFTISKILGLESSSRWNYHDQVT